ncbi:MAG TPA: hypothetical protein VFJ97_14525 [Dermatophilaceae bacterium]|nr:hypothetical protein [Dermatophilaceae bacterium]
MTRGIKVLVGAAAALSLAGGGQVAYHALNQEPATVHAVWSFKAKTAKEVRAHARSIVLAEVVSTAPGADIITRQPNEPGGVDRIPTTRVTVKVVKGYKGLNKAGDELVLFQTGGVTQLPAAPAKGKTAHSDVQQLVLEGDPAYKQGEQYLLMLEPGPQGMLRPVSPQGRFRLDRSTGSLTSMVKDTATAELSGKKLTGVETTLRSS